MQIGENILMTVIAETATVDMGQLDLLISEFEDNFVRVDEHISHLLEQDWNQKLLEMLPFIFAFISRILTTKNFSSI